MGYVTTYGNGLLLNTIFTQDTTNYPAPTSFSVALLTASPDRNSTSATLVEPASSIAGTAYINGADYYNVSGGTYVTYSILPSNAMTYTFSNGQQVSVTGINSTFNLTGTVRDTILTNTNTVGAWAAGTYSVGDVAYTTTGNVTLYYQCISAVTSANTTPQKSDTTHWSFVPLSLYTQFTIFYPTATPFSTTFTASGTYGTAVGNTGYSRVSYSRGTSYWTYGQSSVYNTNLISFTTPYSDWGAIVGWALLDNNSNILACGDLQQNVYVQKNALVSLPVGSLRMYLN
jgi:hypothetical protein